MTVADHLGLLVHAGAIEADMALDGDGDRPVEPRGDRMAALRVQDLPGALVRVRRKAVEPLVQLADYAAGVTNRLHSEKVGATIYEEYLKRKRGCCVCGLR